ncbi:MAG: DUF448 domain-containing protein [Desulfuromonadales bacterium]|nr:DUF448 domain-containing protein [Desulfuromonadales bacterium]
MSRQKQQEKPQRSCLGCRQSSDRDRLIRFVLSPHAEVVPDIEAKLPGRGAYTCVSEECLRAAFKQRQFNRAFKREVVVVSPDEMTENVISIMQKRILGYLGLANRAGQVVSGGSMVSDAIKGGRKPGLILLAIDVSEDIGKKIEMLAAVHHIVCMRVMKKDDFGAILGKAPRSAIAIKAGGFVAQLTNEIERYRNFLGEVRNL